MILYEIFYLRFWRYFSLLTAFLMLFLCVPVSGQEAGKQRDTIRAEEVYVLDRHFSYAISGRDTVLNGTYSLKLKPALPEGLQEQSYRFGELATGFVNNKRQGVFVMQTIFLQPELRNPEPENGIIRIPYSGIIRKTRGEFDENRPVGEWTFLELRRNTASAADSLVHLRAFFGSNGKLKDRFRLADRNNAVVIAGNFKDGAFDEGLNVRSGSDGSLLLNFGFENGLLVSVNRAGKPALRAGYNSQERKISFVQQPLDSLYPKIMSYYLNLPEDEWEEVLRPFKMIYNSFSWLEGENSIMMEHLPGESNFQLPLVKVPLYETTPEEQEIVLRKRERIQELNQRIDDLLHVSSFALNKSSEKELSSLYARLQVVKDRLEHQQKVSEILAGPLLQHIDPDLFIRRRLAEVTPADTATYTFSGEQFREPMSFSFETEGLSSFEQYRAYISSLEESFLNINEQIGRYLEHVELEKRLSESEESLSDLSVDIEQLADSMALNMYSEEISNMYKQAFVGFKDMLLKEYVEMAPARRQPALEGLVNCFEQMRSKLKNAPVLAGKEKIVDEAYMDTHLNPYTYTEEEERIFERLYSAYTDILVPFLINRMMTAQNCESFLEKAENLERLQDFMLKALSENPKRMERRIRRTDSPEAIIRKLEIPVVL